VKSATWLRIVLAIAVLALAGACTAGPGGSGSGAAVNLQDEVTATAKGLDDALAAYKTGDKVKADELVGAAYVDHFELVEGPLGKVDVALMERLEDTIRTELRNAMKDGKPVADVEVIAARAKADLATAATKLK